MPSNHAASSLWNNEDWRDSTVKRGRAPVNNSLHCVDLNSTKMFRTSGVTGEVLLDVSRQVLQTSWIGDLCMQLAARLLEMMSVQYGFPSP